ncbi:MAG: hypothetical protein KXJ53_09170 [Phenylobacterium sp.]|nr:hypothetical protein [Phenylobacterium sp.]
MKGITPATQARRRPGRTRRDAPEATHMAEQLASEAGAMWEGRWAAFYGLLASPLVGGTSRKTIGEKLGLMCVTLTHALRAAAPPGAAWRTSLRLDDSGAPIGVLMAKDDDAFTVPVRLERRSLVIGGRRVFLVSRGAALAALEALAGEAGAYFGAPLRPVA